MGEYFRFKVQLIGVKPPIFRRFLLHAKASFYDLHTAIQKACGWDNSHPFAFRKTKRGDTIAGIPYTDASWGHVPDAERIALAKWFSLTGNKACVYEYDFGDGWLHDVKLQTIERHDGEWHRRLLDGSRAFPPDDCGGLGGYQNCVAIATGSKCAYGPDHAAELATWLGAWNPETFNMVLTKGKFDR